eukprot:scaffold6474_cov139-Isochrysis_galbana.AAC.5
MNSRKSQLGRGVRLLGFWALGRHAVPSICTRKTIGRVFSYLRSSHISNVLCGVTLRRSAAQMSGVKTSHSMGGARAER